MMVMPAHRPAHLWMSDLQKAKVEGGTLKPKFNIQEIIERINDPNAPEQALIPTSPRSVEACFRLGVDPVDLQYHPAQWYRRKDDADEEVSALRYERYEAVRQDRLRELMDQRKQLVDEGWAPAGASKEGLRREDSRKEASSSMVELERQRLEVMRRRQERDMQQMVAHEINRKELLDKQQKKLDELEQRNAEQVQQRMEHEAARMTKQHEIEMQKAAEERENNKRARLLSEDHYRHEKKMQHDKAEADKEIKRRAYLDDMERRRKADDLRRETEAILAAQVEEVRLRKLDMDRRDGERAKRMETEAKERALANAEKRKKADLRIMSALQQNDTLTHRKRSAYESKEAEAAARRKEMEEIHAKEEERKHQEDARKQRERMDKYSVAMETEEQRKSSIRSRAEDKEQMLSDLYQRRKKEHDIKKVESEFHLKLRLDKVDSIQKTGLYQRSMLLERIMGDYEKSRSLMRERLDLQDQRKEANMSASLQRQQMSDMMAVRAMTEMKNTARNLGGVAGSHQDKKMQQRKRPGTSPN
mmetsp:Transcript_3797/g.6305  ORF Transcript_3797/g.6305 Transcript_3797/m.6305 type:complete len:532 (+) Transcript_3797:99-1694(+)|eukprot:CAMPEP_0119114478 /NCGR_PEP_ID=MMETSP1180-20130426/47648_1 /TAXON_ID=3052 ORGANISM="Chlamydomonas cf sp, Strain CCMP681" /NCGR_SAMPLE_ID=MMETSP1180 /ASSEMBLY_ACC=CAM_ASM_000741 /LENGTH=531 /DNA_ID=CAMNT_0007103039 /DNA_START=93 /DNA_END=1688 /DNA_ORIENTATION=+